MKTLWLLIFLFLKKGPSSIISKISSVVILPFLLSLTIALQIPATLTLKFFFAQSFSSAEKCLTYLPGSSRHQLPSHTRLVLQGALLCPPFQPELQSEIL